MTDTTFEAECAIAFLHSFDPTGWHNLVAIHPDTKKVIGCTFPPAAKDMFDWIERHNGESNVYFSVNEPRPDAPHSKLKKTDIANVRAVYTDIDPQAGVDLAAEKARLISIAEQSDADVIIDSGGGVQLFWRLEEKQPAHDFEWAEGCNRRVAQDFHGDHTWDVNRIMRLPFTTNLPDRKKRALGRVPAPARLLRQMDIAGWSRGAIEQSFPPVPIAHKEMQDTSDATRAVSAAIRASGFDTFTAFEDLPEQLANRFNAALAADKALRDLWMGEAAGNEHRFSLVTLLRKHGFTVEEYACLAQVWHRSTSKPERPLARELARDWVRSPIIFSAMDEFEPIEIPAQMPKTTAKFYSLSFAEAANGALDNDSVPLIEGLLDCGTLAVMYGKPNDGKTFVALDMAAAIAAGTPWSGRETCQGLTFYIAAEGGTAFKRRIAAVRQGKSLVDETPMRTFPFAIDMFGSPGNVQTLIDHINSTAKEIGQIPRLLIVDTLNRSFGAGDENSGQDMGRFRSHLDMVREATGVTVVVVHHSGKDVSKGSRGHSSLLGAIDTEIEISKDDRTGAGLIKNTKQRDGERTADIQFRLRSIEIGVDKHGRTVTSCVVDYPSIDEFGPIPLSSTETRFKEALVVALGDNDSGTNWNSWCKAYRQMLDPTWSPDKPEPKGCSSRNLEKLRKVLLEYGHITKDVNDIYAPGKPSR